MGGTYRPREGKDPRLAIEWERGPARSGLARSPARSRSSCRGMKCWCATSRRRAPSYGRRHLRWHVRPLRPALRTNVDRLRSARSLDGEGNPIKKTGMLAFGQEPNPDADDGTFVGTLIDVTRPDEVSS